MRFSTIIIALLAPILVMSAVIQPKAEANVESVPIHTMAGKSGQLTVKLNYASNLKNEDTVGRSDVFVEMWLDKSYKQRSKEVKGPNPVFDETFQFPVRSGQDKLYIRVLDKDTLSNDKIGEATVSLDAVMSRGSTGPMDVKLPRWLGLRSNGSVNIQMRFVESR